MTKTFTQNDLIRYYYKETTEKESSKIQNALICDPVLQDQYKEICRMLKELNKVQLEPSEKSVEAILKFSRSQNLHTLNK